MSEVFLAMDFMVGVADQAYAAAAVGKAQEAIAAARRSGIRVIFTKVGFRAGHPEVSKQNKVFAPLIGTGKLVGASSALASPFATQGNEPLLDKKRFSAFAGSGLWAIVRASGATSVTMCGLSTSGVVLSTALELIDADYDVTILSDACADPVANLSDTVMRDILAHRANVCTVGAWASDGTAR